jgi:hypothetical protein
MQDPILLAHPVRPRPERTETGHEAAVATGGVSTGGVSTGTGRLRNGNPPGDLRLAPRCGARTRSGCACRQPAMKNGRCRLHGGKSTGPRTADGRARARKAHLRHGLRTRYFTALRRERVRCRRNLDTLITAGSAVIAIAAGRPLPWAYVRWAEALPARVWGRADPEVVAVCLKLHRHAPADSVAAHSDAHSPVDMGSGAGFQDRPRRRPPSQPRTGLLLNAGTTYDVS